jgi:hypothetical protein
MKKNTKKRNSKKFIKNKINSKKKYIKKFKKTIRKNKITKKKRGGDFNNEQQKELISILQDKGLNPEQISEIMKNLNLIAQINSSTLWYGYLKFALRNLPNEILPDGSNSIVNWSKERLEVARDNVGTDAEDY